MRRDPGAIRALRGVQFTAAIRLMTEIVDLSRFEYPRQLMVWFGISPSEHSSGARRKLGDITKVGSSYARKLLVKAAWSDYVPVRITRWAPDF